MKRLYLMQLVIIAAAVIFIAFKRPAPRCYPLVKEENFSLLPDTTKIKLEKTRLSDMPVLFIHDTAATTAAIGLRFTRDYGELMQFINSNHLTSARFIGWYYTTQPPWLMDIAVETDRLPAQTSGRIQAKMQIGGEVLIAHFWGPYQQVGEAYSKIQQWLVQNNRSARENPFEVYVNDPASVANPSELQTDIYQPLE